MKILYTFFFVFTSIAVFAAPNDSTFATGDTPTGFASVNAMGVNGTTGGAGGDTLYFTNGTDLYNFLDDRKDPSFNQNMPPKICVIVGTLTSTKKQLEIKQTYNITFIGKGTDAAFEGTGLFVKQSYNIIIRNIQFRNAPIDGVAIQYPEAHHVWIDHCSFTDSPDIDTGDARHDGALDITHGSSYVTVSWCYFTNHTKTCLLGHSDDNDAEDLDKLKTTYHHNWFDNTSQRHPRVRYADCHVYNNYYTTKGRMLYGIASTAKAKVLLEGNYFDGVGFPAYVGYAESPAGDLLERNNIYNNSGTPQSTGIAFEPTTYYQYSIDNASDVPALVRNNAGSGKMISGVEANTADMKPTTCLLAQNYPNPFNPSTTIKYSVNATGKVTLKIFDVLGNEIAVLVNKEMQPGNHEAQFNAAGLSSGMYIYTLRTTDGMQSKKMLFIK
jgi:pectate lyase